MKEEIIVMKVGKFITKEVKRNPYGFIGCSTTEDVLLAAGSEIWSNILCEAGYSPRFYITEVNNMSKRFLKLLNRIVEMCGEDYGKSIVELANNEINK